MGNNYKREAPLSKALRFYNIGSFNGAICERMSRRCLQWPKSYVKKFHFRFQRSLNFNAVVLTTKTTTTITATATKAQKKQQKGGH